MKGKQSEHLFFKAIYRLLISFIIFCIMYIHNNIMYVYLFIYTVDNQTDNQTFYFCSPPQK